MDTSVPSLFRTSTWYECSPSRNELEDQITPYVATHRLHAHYTVSAIIYFYTTQQGDVNFDPMIKVHPFAMFIPEPDTLTTHRLYLRVTPDPWRHKAHTMVTTSQLCTGVCRNSNLLSRQQAKIELNSKPSA